MQSISPEIIFRGNDAWENALPQIAKLTKSPFVLGRSIYTNDLRNKIFIDLKNHNLNYKIREHSLKKIPLLLICRKKEVDSNTVTIRKLDSKKQESMDLEKFLKKYSTLSKPPIN